MDSLVQPACILVYIECNPAPGGSPFELSSIPFPSEILVWWFVLGSALGRLTTLDAFPEVSGEVDSLIVKACAKACEESNIEVELGPVEAALMRIMYSMVPSLTHASKIKDQICQLHGQVKDIAHAHVRISYGFKDLSDCIRLTEHAKEQTKAENCQLVSMLLEKLAFAYLVRVHISCDISTNTDGPLTGSEQLYTARNHVQAAANCQSNRSAVVWW